MWKARIEKRSKSRARLIFAFPFILFAPSLLSESLEQVRDVVVTRFSGRQLISPNTGTTQRLMCCGENTRLALWGGGGVGIRYSDGNLLWTSETQQHLCQQ